MSNQIVQTVPGDSIPDQVYELLELTSQPQGIRFADIPQHLRDAFDYALAAKLVTYATECRPPLGLPTGATWVYILEAGIVALAARRMRDQDRRLLDVPGSSVSDPSVPMTVKEAAARWGGDMSASKLSRLMRRGTVRYRKLTRQSFVFSRDDIPNLPGQQKN